MPLSAGTRLVSHFFLEAKLLYHFYWVEDGNGPVRVLARG